MKITRKKPAEVYARGIPRGTVFDGVIGGHRGPFLRSYDRIISLTNPAYTWDVGCPLIESPAFLANYLPLDAELVIHGPAKEIGL